MNNPPAAVKTVMEGVCIVLGKETKVIKLDVDLHVFPLRLQVSPHAGSW